MDIYDLRRSTTSFTWPLLILTTAVILLSACDSFYFTQPTVDQIEISDVPTDLPPTDIPISETSPVAQPVSPTEVIESTPTHQVFLPDVSQGEDNSATPDAQEGSNAQLAYLSGGNIWLVDFPAGEPRPLTETGDLLNFAWAPDGSRIATYNGHGLCQLLPDGSDAGCIDLGMDDFQAQVPRQIAWAPDLSSITLWNNANPWDEQAIGWIIVPLDGATNQIQVLDPVDWGASLSPDNEPGGVTGEALYLSDGTLIGTVTHRWLCGEGGCHYQLYYYDSARGNLLPYPNKPEEGFSEGMGLVLSPDMELLYNFGTFHTGCEAYITFVDAFDLDGGTRRIYDFPQQAINALAIAPDGTRAIIAHNAGCSTQNQDEWAQTCGLAQGFDVYPMQSWDLESNERIDLLPGIQPAWSSDGNWLAFRSCLSQTATGSWEGTPNGPPGIYVLEWVNNTTIRIADGEMPRWRP